MGDQRPGWPLAISSPTLAQHPAGERIVGEALEHLGLQGSEVREANLQLLWNPLVDIE